MDQKGSIENLHDQMPAVFNTRVNPNWKALIEALGQQDQNTIDLIESIRQQFFLKTATRPYIDRIGTANLVQRPRFVGMDDQSFRDFIPVMAYSPKQVKLVLDKILDLFFFKDSTTSFVASTKFSPFTLTDGWELTYIVDSYIEERVFFSADDFTNIAVATANEIVAAINRQVVHSYAIAFEDSISKQTYIRIFTNTIGSKGAIEITGGAANIGLQFTGFNLVSGHGGNTEWSVSKIGDTATMQYTGTGNSPMIDQLQIGDIVIITKATNYGSFQITDVNPSDDNFKFKNIFATNETFTQSLVNDVKFMRPYKSNVYLQDRRAVVWEVRSGEIIVEMPPSPPVVKRNRKGAAHINGIVSNVLSVVDPNTLQLTTPSEFPTTGAQFYFIPLGEIQTYDPSDLSTSIFNFKNKLSSDMPIYSYVSKSGDLLGGITPDLPTLAATNLINITTANRDNANTLTIITTTPNDFEVDEFVVVENAVQGIGLGGSTNGTWKITEIVSTTQFKAYSFGGPSGSRNSTGGTARVERKGIAQSGGLVILRSAQLDDKKIGPFLWDINASFILSSLTANLTLEIKAGNTQRNIEVTTNDIPDQQGQLIFDFGTTRQEGPVKYYLKPNANTLQLDPSYVFQHNHDVGSAVTMIRRRGGIEFDGFGSEHAPYITDPAAARAVLQELMQELKSVGVFINFLIRYPQFFYSTIDTYKSGIDPDTINQ